MRRHSDPLLTLDERIEAGTSSHRFMQSDWLENGYEPIDLIRPGEILLEELIKSTGIRVALHWAPTAEF
jgi:hypothetical protein